MKKLVFPIMLCVVLSLTCCKSKENAEVSTLTSGIDFANLDTTVSPAEDFYQYACGGWMKNHPLTSEYSRYGSFDVLGENNQLQLKDLIEETAATTHDKGTVAQKIGDLFNMGMDSVTIEKQGAEPLANELQTIANVQSKKELTKLMADMNLDGIDPFIGIFGEADPDNSSMNIAWVWQNGLGIGDRDYYLQADQQEVRDQYVALMTEMMSASGYSKMVNNEGKEADMAKAVMKMETAMAQAFMDKNTLRDPFKTHNIKTIDEFQQLIPAIDIKSYLDIQGLGSLETVNIGQVDYIKTLNNILNTTDLNTIKAYLAWNVINEAAPFLSSEFVNANFNFYGKVLSGKEENKPRWKRVVSTVDGCLGEAVGQLYVEKYFPAEAKDRMMKLVGNLQTALGERIADASWMSDATKKLAKEKLDAMIVKIGYPEKWRDYSALEIENDSYYANVVRARRFECAYQMSKIGKPVDPTEWLMTPQTVNAYYNPTTNEICFPAGILQPPFFDMNADDAVNYGAIGVVIGHEMTHGFDDQGRNYDKVGNLNNWWTEEDAANFTARAQVLVDYFNGIEVAPGLFANGQFTLGENIADNGGVNISLQALQKAKSEGTIQEEMDGFTANQRFFLAYANVWAGNIRDKEIVRRTTEDPHSLGKWRVNATLPHIDGFAEAFGIKEGDKMFVAPEKRAHIW
ncbi:MAG: M13 family metallopeptidase [Bacteroidales bacterium]|nr:M13 family metallopeptidase [Bacteroidales bacterium]